MEVNNGKLNSMVSDAKVYQKLKSDPTPVFKHKLIAFLTKLKSEGKITQAQYYHLYSTPDMTQRLHGYYKCIKRVYIYTPPIYLGLHML